LCFRFLYLLPLAAIAPNRMTRYTAHIFNSIRKSTARRY